MQKMKLIDTWFTAEGKNEDKPFLLRGRDSLKNLVDSKLYADRIEIIWDFESNDNSGMPPENLMKLMEKVENALVDSFEFDMHSILVAVYLWNNSKTWFWYTRSWTTFKDRLNDTLGDFERLPIEITRTKDKYWKEYKEILKGSGIELK